MVTNTTNGNCHGCQRAACLTWPDTHWQGQHGPARCAHTTGCGAGMVRIAKARPCCTPSYNAKHMANKGRFSTAGTNGRDARTNQTTLPAADRQCSCSSAQASNLKPQNTDCQPSTGAHTQAAAVTASAQRPLCLSCPDERDDPRISAKQLTAASTAALVSHIPVRMHCHSVKGIIGKHSMHVQLTGPNPGLLP